MNEELKPCPFCGKKAILITTKEKINIGGVYFEKQYLGCKTLECFGNAWIAGREFCTRSTEQNIKAWNTRSGDQNE